MAKTVSAGDQRALVDRLMSACGGSYSPETRRKYFISGPQWAASYQGQALFHAPTRQPVSAADVIRQFAEVGIGYWSSHDTDVIPTEDLMTDRQAEIVAGISRSNDAQQIFEANREILTLHELIAHRLVEILLGLHRGRKIIARA
jgi:hypothetical protein